jgi:hypothetical protein
MYYVFDNQDGTFEEPSTDDRTQKEEQVLRQLSQQEYETLDATNKAKAEALAAYEAAINTGATITGILSSPIEVGIADADQQRWTAGLVARSNAETLADEEDRARFNNLRISTLIGPVIDANGAAHDMTVTQYRERCKSITLHVGALRLASSP